MKKIIIAIFIVIATLGIAAGTTAKKAPVKTTSKTTTTTKKSTSTPKKEVTDPYVGWWYHEYDETLEDEYSGAEGNFLVIITKENNEYYEKVYTGSSKTKGLELCKKYQGMKQKVKNIKDDFKTYKYKKATKNQLDDLKYNIENAKWISQKECDAAN